MIGYSLLTNLHYLPSIASFMQLYRAEVIIFEACNFYKKQTYHNRCYIRSSQKVDKLIVPVCNAHKPTMFQDVWIDNRSNWPQKHWRAIMAAYGKTPYFGVLGEMLQRVFCQRYERLISLNTHMLKVCFQFLQIEKKINFTTSYRPEAQEGEYDARDQFNPKKQVDFSTPTYSQLFDYPFTPNLSILDMLFNQGPDVHKLI